jgi:23S rRNA (guanine745-N1)-methyltransferase
MVSARAKVLGEGHFVPLARTIEDLSARYCSAGFIVEAGAGVGYYISRVLDCFPESWGLAIDLSKFAARRAAKANDRLNTVVADIWEELPLKDQSVDLALNVFAPRPARELSRTLRAGGMLIVAIPTKQHLGELRRALKLIDIDPDKQARVADRLNPFFKCLGRRICEWEMKLSQQAIESLVRMGPAARHINTATLAREMAALPANVSVSGSVEVYVYVRA